MSAGSILKIRAALTQAFIGLDLFDDDAMQWENQKFTPPTDKAWGSFYFLPSQPGVATLGPDGADNQEGLVQIDLNHAPDSGSAIAEAQVESLRNLFTAGARFVYEGQTVTVKSCGRSQGRIVNNFFRVSVSVYFYAHINRS